MVIDSFYTLAFGIAATMLIISEIVFFTNDIGFFNWGRKAYRNVTAICNDFSNGKYYNPWGSVKPIIINPSRKEMTELSEANSLSQRAVYADMFGFKLTMNGITHNEVNVLRTRLYSRLLQNRGPSNLAALYPYLQKRLETVLDQQLQKGIVKSDGPVSIALAPSVRTISSKLMALIFFGDKASADQEFADALLTYSADLVKCLAAFQVFPAIFSGLIHKIITKNGRAMHLLQNRFKHLMRSDYGESKDVKDRTILHNMIEIIQEQEGSPEYWTTDITSQALLGVWFAASHQPWMNLDFILLELAQRPEWQLRLREEIGNISESNYESLDRLPYLDSFIKESVRMNPLDTHAIRRKALDDYQFKRGDYFLKKGTTACVSAIDILNDKNVYVNPEKWDGERFVTGPSPMRGTKFSDVSEHFPTWGFGSLACPGRFHATLVLKIVIARLVSEYDIFLESKGRVKFMWETFTFPYDSTRVLLKKVN
ncbi:cytochrome P450 [Talaromyces proteolyticus]|uniref:Cytochrome P450 n=1 Tax=Talaromyces proteolyticus TaxID=1131652 RepID=A0AAD4KU32_9EURO|nr:cytochrome P450 [Talaromyces proteolyticus]KAH8696089.1 cytochrome P450 [Talaromyces proteolyticus]